MLLFGLVSYSSLFVLLECCATYCADLYLQTIYCEPARVATCQEQTPIKQGSGGDCTKLAVFEILSLREVSRAWKGGSVIASLKRDKKGGSRLMKTGHWV